MDQDEAQDPKLEARKAALELRRARLRDYVDTVQDIIEALPLPTTLIEAQRAVRVAASLDRTLVRLYSEPDLRCVAAMERAARRLKLAPLPEIDDEPEEPSTPESLYRKQKELQDRIFRIVKNKDPERYKTEIIPWLAAQQTAEDASSQAPVCTADNFARSSAFDPPKSDKPISNSPNSNKPGDATPAPNLAKTEMAKPEPPKRSGPSIRSLAPDWPPWPPR